MEFVKKFECIKCHDSMQIDGVSEKEIEDGFAEEGWVHIDGKDYCSKCAGSVEKADCSCGKE